MSITYTPVTGTNGNDFMFFQGDLTSLNMTITNSYSGETLQIDDDFNLNSASYEGLAGIDTLFMTNVGDAFFLTSDTGVQLLANVERIIAGDGGDLIILDSTDIALGDLFIDGGRSDDIIWSNEGNDTLRGFEGNDILHGGPGDDTLLGQADNDTLYGGEGNDMLDGGTGEDQLFGDVGDDTLYGGDGNDVLIGGPDENSDVYQEIVESHVFTDTVEFPTLDNKTRPQNIAESEQALGVAAGDLSVDFDTTLTVTYQGSEASFDNSLGFYQIAEDGTIEAVSLVFANVKDYEAGDSMTLDLEAGDFGFFMIANGAHKNHDYSNLDLENGEFQFVYDYGGAGQRAATINDAEDDISLIFTDGSSESVIVGSNNHIYHTTTRDGDTSLNSDGEAHVVSGIAEGGDNSTLRIGFEDLPNLGDADYDDVVFDIAIEGHVTEVLTVDDADVLYGGAGDDVIDGGVGDDVLFGGEGADTLYGGQGDDQFVFDVLDGMTDTVMDFEFGADGDVLNVTDILDGYDPLSDAISDFVQFTQSGTDSVMEINADGSAGGSFEAVAIIYGGIGNETLASLIDQGNLVVDQAAVV